MIAASYAILSSALAMFLAFAIDLSRVITENEALSQAASLTCERATSLDPADFPGDDDYADRLAHIEQIAQTIGQLDKTGEVLRKINAQFSVERNNDNFVVHAGGESSSGFAKLAVGDTISHALELTCPEIALATPEYQFVHYFSEDFEAYKDLVVPGEFTMFYNPEKWELTYGPLEIQYKAFDEMGEDVYAELSSNAKIRMDTRLFLDEGLHILSFKLRSRPLFFGDNSIDLYFGPTSRSIWSRLSYQPYITHGVWTSHEYYFHIDQPGEHMLTFWAAGDNDNGGGFIDDIVFRKL